MHEINYILYVLELSCAPYCNLIGAWKFLNGDKTDVHDFLDSLSLPRCVGGAEYETMKGGGVIVGFYGIYIYLIFAVHSHLCGAHSGSTQ